MNKDQKSKNKNPKELKVRVGQRVPERGYPLVRGQDPAPYSSREKLSLPMISPAHPKNNTVILSFNNLQKGNSSRGGKSHYILPIAFLPGKRGADMIDFPVFPRKFHQTFSSTTDLPRVPTKQPHKKKASKQQSVW